MLAERYYTLICILSKSKDRKDIFMSNFNKVPDCEQDAIRTNDDVVLDTISALALAGAELGGLEDE